MKKSLLFVVLVMCVLCSCSNDQEPYFVHETNEFTMKFEEGLASRCNNFRNPDSYQLIGFTTVTFTKEEQAVTRGLFAEYEDSIKAAGGFFVAEDGSYARVYYPMRNAIVKIGKRIIVANDNGELSLPSGVDCKELVVVGRAQTDRSIYTTFNIKIIPSLLYSDNNTLIFDLGERPRACCLMDGAKTVKSASEDINGNNVRCVENHKPFHNCSEAYPSCVNQESDCERRTDICMDYNGWGSDCQPNSRRYFLGSDCSRALMQGHCWNEVMHMF